MESILRMASYQDDNGSVTDISKIFPQTNPDAFLRQGDSVENWDGLQTAWETSMVMLRATDKKKHTSGGNPYTFKSAPASSTVKATSKPTEGKCIHPLLAITPGMTQFEGVGKEYRAAHKRQQYSQYTELLMESLEATSIFLAPASMLAAFSMGRQTALVVDVGAGGCRVTPIVDGLVLQQSQRRNGRGGDWLGNVTWKAMLDEFDTAPKPRYLLRDGSSRAKNKTIEQQALWHRQAMMDLMYEVRTDPFVKLHSMDSPNIRVPFVEKLDSNGHSPPGSPGSVASANAIYHLPDGTAVDLTTSLGKGLQQLPELLFSEALPFSESKEAPSMPSTFSNAPLHQLIKESLLAVGDVDTRKELTGSICLVGGSSLFPNLDSRLSQELSSILPSFVKPKVVASRFSVERSSAAWIGGSILTSLGSFQQLWLSRLEYEEYGTSMSIQRFP